MNYSIIGTAGHIDHGKSSLIKALTGFWGDESKEEKRRGITIDLSFSYLKSESKTIGFIDVPGHEKLTSTMICGAYSFDACLVVIDANEGVMPQTKEHLHVLNFLGKKECVVALSKCDLCNEEQIKMQKEAIKKEFKSYENLILNSIVITSIKDDKSINNLKDKLLNLPNPKRDEKGVLRYFVDRAFSVKGHGVVVTGTLFEGALSEGQKVWVSESEKLCEVKTLQVHEQKVKDAHARQRVAINLNKIKLENIKKGMQITQKGYIRGFKSVDIYLACIKGKTLPHNAEVALHVGSRKINGTLLQMRNDEKFEKGFCTFNADDSLIYSVFKDRCIVSLNGEVIAGGEVINPISDPIKKRDKLPILNNLKDDDFLSAFLALTHKHVNGFGLVCAYQRFGLKHEASLSYLRQNDEIFVDEKALIVYPKEALNKVENIILDIYAKNPHALISEKSLSLKYRWVSENLALKALEKLQKNSFLKVVNGVWIKEGIDSKKLQNTLQNRIFHTLEEGGFSPLAPYNIYDNLDIDRKTGDNALKALTRAKKVVRLEHNFFITSDILVNAMTLCRNIIKTNGYVDIKSLKEKLPLSRKYLIAYLEYLDKFDDIGKDGVKRVMR